MKRKASTWESVFSYTTLPASISHPCLCQPPGHIGQISGSPAKCYRAAKPLPFGNTQCAVPTSIPGFSIAGMTFQGPEQTSDIEALIRQRARWASAIQTSSSNGKTFDDGKANRWRDDISRISGVGSRAGTGLLDTRSGRQRGRLGCE
jgi:hypothetical protein